MDKSAAHLEAFERMKANAFFLVGSILYMPVSIWGLVAEKKGTGNPNEESWLYVTILIAATLAYLANGLLETRTAYLAYRRVITNNLSEGLPRGEIVNGLLFTIAATLELCFALVGRNILLLVLSAHFYVANALLTLWLRRRADMSSQPHRMVRAGDILFLLGASMDMTGTYLERRPSVTAGYAGLWLASSVAWLIDALLYLAADKLSLDEDDEAVSKPSEPMMSESELPATGASSKLSNIV